MNVQTFEYNRDYSPSAPFIEVEINNFELSATFVKTQAQIDTGADATMIPFSILEKIGARFEATHVAHDFSGRTHIVDLYSTIVKLAGYQFHVQAIAQDNTNESVIGRDILNHLEICLNGSAGVTEIQLNE